MQYTSTDGQNWSYGGVLCSRSSAEVDGVWTGTMWECPQLFRVGADWALVVSVWDNDKLHYVAGAVGRYDGATFTAERWTRLTHDETAYAMTSFTDSVGRPCMMSWLREDAAHAPGARQWAGALSLPMVVGISRERTLHLRPHPNLDALRSGGAITVDGGGGPFKVTAASGGLDIALPVGTWRLLLLAGSERVLAIEMAAGRSDLVVTRAISDPASTVPVTVDVIRVVIDSGVVEIYAGGGSCALRVPADRETDLSISGLEPGQVTIHRLFRRCPTEPMGVQGVPPFQRPDIEKCW